MKYVDVGDVRCSRVVIGGMRYAGKPLRQVEEIIIEALKAGANTFDHADIYGKGDSETVFGLAMKDLEIPRDSLVLQTKCGIRDGYYDFSREHILASVENSAKRMNTDYLDILLLHRPDTLMEPDEVYEAFDMDKRSKPQVKQALIGLRNSLDAIGVEWCSCSWNPQYKGLDDYFLAKTMCMQPDLVAA